VKTTTRLAANLYTALVRLYPRPFRIEFEEEMQAVFVEAVTAAAEQGSLALLRLCLRELRDWPKLALGEYRRCLSHWGREMIKSETSPGQTGPGLLPIPSAGPASDLTVLVISQKIITSRLFDLAFATAWLLVAAPLLLVIPVLIKLDSPGPVLFRQQRVGKYGRPFTMYKFRSMIDGAEKLPSSNHRPGDSRLTRTGRFIRRVKLDELPQLFNVIKGDLSALGSRPETTTLQGSPHDRL